MFGLINKIIKSFENMWLMNVWYFKKVRRVISLVLHSGNF